MLHTDGSHSISDLFKKFQSLSNFLRGKRKVMFQSCEKCFSCHFTEKHRKCQHSQLSISQLFTMEITFPYLGRESRTTQSGQRYEYDVCAQALFSMFKRLSALF